MAREHGWDIQINKDWCKKCGLCVAFCPRQILQMADVVKVVDKERCIGCLQCEMHCPEFAIMVRRREH